jgi:hypothetical protein
MRQFCALKRRWCRRGKKKIKRNGQNKKEGIMNKFLQTFSLLAVVSIFIGITLHNAEADNCTAVKDRELLYSSGHYLHSLQPIKPGFDPFGYNYQAHLFNGYYANAYLGRDGFPPYEGDDVAYFQRLVSEGYPQDGSGKYACEYKWYWPYRDVVLNMKWNDAWLSNKDCDGDGLLDRYYGYDSYIGSGAWETNYQSGTYLDGNGKECHWNYFVKIVAVPESASSEGEIWYAEDGTEIGPSIWGAFAIVQQVYNDPCDGYHGIEYLSPAGPGFGKW